MDKMTKQIDGWGEVGIDSQASPGNGSYYVKCYVNGYDAVGFDTEEEALQELEFVIYELRENSESDSEVPFD